MSRDESREAACRSGRMLAAALLAVLACASAVGAQARSVEERASQRWRWRLIDGPTPKTTFISVREWKDGTLVAATESNLLAYDGYTWSALPGSEQIDRVSLGDVIPLSSGYTVTTVYDVLLVSEDGTIRSVSETSAPTSTTRAVELPDGSWAVGANRRILRLDPAAFEDGWTNMMPAPTSAWPARGLAADEDGRLWAATTEGLWHHDGVEWKRLRHHAPLVGDEVRTFDSWTIFARGGRAVMLPSLMEEGAPAYLATPDGAEPFWDERGPVRIDAAVMTSDGSIVVAARGPALRVLRDGIWHEIATSSFLHDDVISLAFTEGERLAAVTRAGRLWVCNLASDRWVTHRPDLMESDGVVNALAPASAGGVWVAMNSGIARFDGESFVDVHEVAGETGVSLLRVTGIVEDDQGRVWIGSGSGFRGTLSLENGRWTRHNDPEVFGGKYAHVIRKGEGAIWFLMLGNPDVAAFTGGLVEMRDEVFTGYDSLAGQRLNRTYDIAFAPDGRRLLASLDSVLAYDGQTWSPMPFGTDPVARSVGEANRSAFAVHIDRQGTPWVGFGLHAPGVLAGEDGVLIGRTQPDWQLATAASFAETADGRLWFASGQGLFLVDGDAVHRISVNSDVPSFWPMLPDGSGGLWLGGLAGRAGLVHFQPDDVDPPRTRELSVEVGADRTATARWASSDRWSDSSPNELHFRLAVDDGPWIDVGHRFEWTLDEPDTGEHELTVVAVDRMGNVEAAPATASYRVPPPLYLSPPMLVVLGALVGALAWLGVVRTNRRSERREARRAQQDLNERLSRLTLRLLTSQEDERRRVSREMHDDLGQLLTAVCIDLQRAGTLTDEARRSEAMERALSTARTTLDRVREISSILRPPVLDDLGLHDAIHSAVMDFTNVTGVDVQATVDLGDAELPDAVAGHVYRILQEALTNVGRHAQTDTVHVTVQAVNGRVELEVRDEGVGFQLDAVPLDARFGLLGMRERAELTGGHFKIHSRPGAGTTVHASIPSLGQSHTNDSA